MRRLFKHYCLTKQLASKTSRSVYLAHRISDASEKVVIKIFASQCFTLEPESESFLQQVEKIKQLHHTHIVPILDIGIEQGQPYIVSAYMPNESLRVYLDRLSQARLDLQEALTIILQIGQALGYAHEHGLLHGNIKPENIFFNEAGEVLITDFRLASFIEVTGLDYKSNLSTLSYMAPEQFMGLITEKSDQYALACLAYELITGQVPFYAQKFSSMWSKHNSQLPIPLSELVPWLSKPLEEALLKAMAKDPSERYTDVSAFLRTLQTTLPSPKSIFIPSRAISTTNSPMPFPFSLTQMIENMESQVPLTPLLEKMEENQPSLATLPHQSLEHVHSEYNTSMSLLRSAGETHIDFLAEEQRSGGHKRPNAIWLAIALSSLILLMRAVVPQIFLPIHSQEPSRHVNNSPASQTIIHTTDASIPVLPTIEPTPQTQPTQLSIVRTSPGSAVPPLSTSQPIETTLSGSFAEQNSNVYNLTTEGRLDWVHWGLNAPTEVDRKSGVQPLISTYSLIGNGTVQRDSTNSGAYTWSNGTPVASTGGSQPSGIYVQGLNNGFTITIPANTTAQTLKVYVGVYHAKGKLTASLNGKIYQDATLEMNDVNRGSLVDNCIYTLVFSSAPSQRLMVSYTLMASGGSDAYVSLQSATLQ